VQKANKPRARGKRTKNTDNATPKHDESQHLHLPKSAIAPTYTIIQAQPSTPVEHRSSMGGTTIESQGSWPKSNVSIVIKTPNGGNPKSPELLPVGIIC
jgi:hypothetical protein